MTVEQIIERLQRTSWRVWTVGQTSNGMWRCRMIDESWSGRSAFAVLDDPPGPNNPWRVGVGPTILAAVSAAAAGLFSMEDTTPQIPLDLSKTLA